jgi:hypothetical protein
MRGLYGLRTPGGKPPRQLQQPTLQLGQRCRIFYAHQIWTRLRLRPGLFPLPAWDRQTRSPTSHEITLKVSDPFRLPYFYKHTNAVASPRPGIRLCLDGQRMTQLPPFRSSDESGEAMFNIRCLAAARRLLESLREQPEARPHLLVPVGSDLPQRCDGYSWASPTMRGPGRWRDGREVEVSTHSLLLPPRKTTPR